MKNNKRTVNRKLVFALIAYNELNLEKLGQMCVPPVSKPAISMVLKGKSGGVRLIEQISGILHVPSEILFPYL